jgi:hypothetical protein
MRHSLCLVAVGWTALVSVSLGATQTAPDFSKLDSIPLHPGLIEAARTNHISIDRMDAPTNTGKLNLGDSITALITLCKKAEPTSQWLLHFEAVAPGPNDKPAKPEDPLVLYASTGKKMEFTSSPSWVELRTLGPFADGVGKKKPPVMRDERARFTLDEAFLALGMDRAAAAVIRIHHAREAKLITNGLLTISDAPPSPDHARQGKEWADLIHLTDDEQRALAGACPAMMSYFGVVEETPHLEGMMLKVVDLPSVWSIVGHFGVKADLDIDSEHFAPADPAAWGVPTHPPIYYLPMGFRLNNHPALRVTLVVTTPQPPLLACGGIVGLLAEKISEKETYLTVRILSACLARSGPPMSRAAGD